ncbi:MAG: recombination regulator RecX [Solirubrobacterales bacterium]
MNVISIIEPQKRNKQRVNVYIDEEYAFSCELETLVKHNLKQGMNVDPVKLNEIVSHDNYLKCKNCALRIIERGQKSEKEMIDKLKLKGYDEAVIIKTMDFMKEYGFIDDEKLSKSYISQKSTSMGRNKMKAFLYNKGISDDIIRNCMSGVDGEMEEYTALNIAVKRYNVLIKRDTDKNILYKKLGDYLLRKGYSYDICKSVLKNVLSELDGE